MFGLLNIAKPAGLTSRDVVNRVQRLVKPHKVGHAGTLDPLATGVLVLGLGPATRLVEYIQRMPKTYLGTFLLGRTSDTEDIEGQVIELPSPLEPTENELRAALPQFLGTIQQTPPAYSALKVAGQRAYKLARRGEAVELAPRPAQIYDLQLVRFAYPEFQLLIRCGSGTYVRTLARDIAKSLGTDAVMSALVRQAIGPFRIEDALDLDSLTWQRIQEKLLSPALAVADLPQAEVTADECRRLAFGQRIANRWNLAGAEIAAVDAAGGLAAILVPAENGLLKPDKCFVSAENSA